MALALATGARLKPEIRLAQAVSEFEADLTMEQKLRFNSYRTQVHKSPPEIHDVMRLTAEIDQKISSNSKVGRGRCYGPRLTKFLQGVQQFVSLGDIIVGGSQNLVACGVWSLVRMSLMVSDAITYTTGHFALPNCVTLIQINARTRSVHELVWEHGFIWALVCMRSGHAPVQIIPRIEDKY